MYDENILTFTIGPVFDCKDTGLWFTEALRFGLNGDILCETPSGSIKCSLNSIFVRPLAAWYGITTEVVVGDTWKMSVMMTVMVNAIKQSQCVPYLGSGAMKLFGTGFTKWNRKLSSNTKNNTQLKRVKLFSNTKLFY